MPRPRRVFADGTVAVGKRSASRQLGLHCMLLAIALLGACSDDDVGEFYTDWDLAGGCSTDSAGADRRNADGNPVDVCADVDGHWTWISYGAGWCATSRQQAPLLAELSRLAPRDLRVYAVVTAGGEVFSVPSRRDAQQWATSAGLAASRVLFEADGGTRTVPQHLLIGPDGRTWFRYVGLLDTTAMQRIVEEFADGTRLSDVRDLGVR